MTTDRRTVIARTTSVGALLAGGVLGSGLMTSEGTASPPTVLVAGSLQGIAGRIGVATVEAYGSVAARRLLVEGARAPDAIALADPRLFRGLADEVTLFASNALVLAYAESAPHAGAIRTDWPSAINRPDIDIGRSDPDLDPLGYRTVMGLELAAEYGVNADRVLDRSLIFPETALMLALEAGELDAAFVYRNMAVEHDLPYVELPTRIDFSAPDHLDHYATVSYDRGRRTVRGAPIAYGATALTGRGEPWVESLAGATDVLEQAGFAMPGRFPVTVDPTELDWPRMAR